MNKSAIKFSLLLTIVFAIACKRETDDALKYIQQEPPSLIPEIFAPDFISKTNEHEFGSVFSKDGTEFYYGVDLAGKAEIRYTKLEKDSWSEPITIISHDVYSFNDPFLSPTEDRLYFISDRSLQDGAAKKDYDIWFATREKNGWSKPVNAGPNINTTANEYYISFTDKGAMFFSSNKTADDDNTYDFDIYVSQNVNHEFQAAAKLSESINTRQYEADVFVAPDESYVIFCASRDEGLGQGDLYISFKNEDGSWTKSKNMGKPVNSLYHELCPFVTRDGKYFFYTSNKDIYWVDARIIDQYR